MTFDEKDWFLRPFRCEFGVGTGRHAAAFTTVLDLPEWIGPFGSPVAAEQRHKLVETAALAQAERRFSPGEKLLLLKMTPIANRVRPGWDTNQITSHSAAIVHCAG